MILDPIDYLLAIKDDGNMAGCFLSDGDDSRFDGVPDIEIDLGELQNNLAPRQSQGTEKERIQNLLTNITNATARKVELYYYEDWSNIEPLMSSTELAIDSETTGLSPMYRMRSIQVYLPNIKQTAFLDLWDLTSDKTRWLSALLRQIENPKVKKYLQNAIFDLYWLLWKFGILGQNIIDTRLLSQIEKAGQYEGYKFEAGITTPNSLEYLSKEFGFIHDKSLQFSDWSTMPLSQDQIDYASRDAYVTYYIGRELYDRLMLSQPATVTAEMNAIPAFVYMQYVGLPSDPNVLFQMSAKYTTAANKAKQKISNLMPFDPCQREKIDKQREIDESIMLTKKGDRVLKAWQDRPFNPGSPSQIVAYLHQYGYEEYTKKIDKSTGEEKDSSSKDILFEIFADNPNHTELNDIITYRSLSKAASTIGSYLDSFDSVRKAVNVSYTPLATQGMGRSSSGGKNKDDQNPKDKQIKAQNAQNISKLLPSHTAYNLPPIRSFLRAREGFILAEFDLAASHAQFARVLSGDTALQEAYDLEIKLHYYTLASMLAFDGHSLTPEEVRHELTGGAKGEWLAKLKYLYKLAKNVFYSFLNFSGASTLQVQFFKYEIFVSIPDCEKYLEACANAFFGLRHYQREIHALAESRMKYIYSAMGDPLGYFGWTKTCDGSIIWHRAQRTSYGNLSIKIPDVVSAQWLRPEGTVMKNVISKVINLFLQYGLGTDARLITFTHDSFLVEIREGLEAELLPTCDDIITREMRLYIPDYKPEDSWDKAIIGRQWK